jgi:heptosyltransferase III
MRKILVLRGGALGDFIVTLPALALLRQRWPKARIELVGNATAAVLALNRGIIDAAHSQHEARWSALYGDTPLPRELAGWLAEYDLVVNYWPNPDGELGRRFPLRSGQELLSAPAMPTRAPAAAHYCEPLRKLGVEPERYFFSLTPLDQWRRGAPTARDDVSESRNPRGEGAEPPFIAVHPGSGSAKKNWPLERWRELIATLPPPVSLIFGEPELERWSALHPAGFRSHPANAANKPARENDLHLLINRPLEELVSHVAQCRLFLGHDSGVSHLAAACGVPCVLLFGPTDSEVWAPPAPHVTVVRRGPDLSSISLDEVQRTATAALSDQR